jgi:hypothetical protein
MGVMQALISFVEEENDQLRFVSPLFATNTLKENMGASLPYPRPSLRRWFIAGKHRFVFFKRDPLLLVAVAKTGEPYPHVRGAALCLLLSGAPLTKARCPPLTHNSPSPSRFTRPVHYSWPCSSVTCTTSSSPC